MTRRGLLWWLRNARRKQQQTQHDAAVPRPQAIRMQPGWTPLPKVNPRPLNMSAQPSNILPFRPAASLPPVSDSKHDATIAQKLVEWAKLDAGSDRDSGDEQREEG